jgi:hypothetical protein
VKGESPDEGVASDNSTHNFTCLRVGRVCSTAMHPPSRTPRAYHSTPAFEEERLEWQRTGQPHIAPGMHRVAHP